jgi:hypothetical protein
MTTTLMHAVESRIRIVASRGALDASPEDESRWTPGLDSDSQRGGRRSGMFGNSPRSSDSGIGPRWMPNGPQRSFRGRLKISEPAPNVEPYNRQQSTGWVSSDQSRRRLRAVAHGRADCRAARFAGPLLSPSTPTRGDGHATSTVSKKAARRADVRGMAGTGPSSCPPRERG